MLKFQSKVEYYCDNLEVVHKLNTLDTNPNHFNEQYKPIDYDEVLTLREWLSPNFKSFYTRGHQDQRKQPQHLTIPKRLNIKADHFIWSNAKFPLEKHILNTPIVIYVQGRYIPNNYIYVIRSSYGEMEAKSFLLIKY